MVRVLVLGIILCSLGHVHAACSGPLKPLCSLLDVIKRFMAKLAPQNLQLTQAATSVTHGPFNGDPGVDLWVLSDNTGSGVSVSISTLGAAIQSLKMPDLDGVAEDIVLGYDSADGYRDNGPYLGVIVGRVANRVEGAAFTMHNQTYTLTANNGPNTLHGGTEGYHTRLWGAKAVKDGVKLELTSPGGDQGFPGTLQISATYTLSGNQISLEIEASADAPTPVNLAQHSYFNLNGHDGAGRMPPVDDHAVFLSADAFTPVDAKLIPTGEVAPVAGSVMDLSSPSVHDNNKNSSSEVTSGALLGPKLRTFEGMASAAAVAEFTRGSTSASDSDDNNENGDAEEKARKAQEAGRAAAKGPVGFDHNYVLRPGAENEPLKLAAVVTHAASGRSLRVETSAPGVQFYTGNFLDHVAGKDGAVYGRHAGLCLETQHFPSSVSDSSPQRAAFEGLGGATPFVGGAGGTTYTHSVVYTLTTTPRADPKEDSTQSFEEL